MRRWPRAPTKRACWSRAAVSKSGAGVAAARAIALAAVVIAGGALGSCRQARPPVVRPGPPPSAEQLLATLAARQNALRGMNARARATSWIGGDRLRATVLMLV